MSSSSSVPSFQSLRQQRADLEQALKKLQEIEAEQQTVQEGLARVSQGRIVWQQKNTDLQNRRTALIARNPNIDPIARNAMPFSLQASQFGENPSTLKRLRPVIEEEDSTSDDVQPGKKPKEDVDLSIIQEALASDQPDDSAVESLLLAVPQGQINERLDGRTRASKTTLLFLTATKGLFRSVGTLLGRDADQNLTGFTERGREIPLVAVQQIIKEGNLSGEELHNYKEVERQLLEAREKKVEPPQNTNDSNNTVQQKEEPLPEEELRNDKEATPLPEKSQKKVVPIHPAKNAEKEGIESDATERDSETEDTSSRPVLPMTQQPTIPARQNEPVIVSVEPPKLTQTASSPPKATSPFDRMGTLFKTSLQMGPRGFFRKVPLGRKTMSSGTSTHRTSPHHGTLTRSMSVRKKKPPPDINKPDSEQVELKIPSFFYPGLDVEYKGSKWTIISAMNDIKMFSIKRGDSVTPVPFTEVYPWVEEGNKFIPILVWYSSIDGYTEGRLTNDGHTYNITLTDSLKLLDGSPNKRTKALRIQELKSIPYSILPFNAAIAGEPIKVKYTHKPPGKRPGPTILYHCYKFATVRGNK